MTIDQKVAYKSNVAPSNFSLPTAVLAATGGIAGAVSGGPLAAGLGAFTGYVVGQYFDK